MVAKGCGPHKPPDAASPRGRLRRDRRRGEGHLSTSWREQPVDNLKCESPNADGLKSAAILTIAGSVDYISFNGHHTGFGKVFVDLYQM